MKTEAMIDRFTETGQAVVLAETIGKEFFIEKEKLPNGVGRGAYLTLKLDGNEVVGIEYDQEKTLERRSVVQSKLAQLKERSSGSRFEKK